MQLRDETALVLCNLRVHKGSKIKMNVVLLGAETRR